MIKKGDLTQGNTMRILFTFMLPILLGQLIQNFYNIVDRMVVGHFINNTALAAVSLAGPIFNLFVAAANGMSAGGGVIISQYFGSGDKAKTHKSICTFLIFQGVVAALMGLIGLFILKPILVGMNAPAESVNDAFWYLAIFMIGLAPNFLYFAFAAAYRALGDSVTPLIILFVCSVMKIGLNFVFVAGLGWGVPGVAMATIVSQTICTVFSYLLFRKRLRELHTPTERGINRFFDKDICWKITKLAIPSTIQMSAASLSSILLQSWINSYGMAHISAYSTSISIENLATMPSMSMGTAISAFVAQNIGARKMERVHQGVKSSSIQIVIIGIIGMLVVFPFAEQWMSLFVQKGAEGSDLIIQLGAAQTRFCILFAVFNGLKFVGENALKGVGDMKFIMFISFLTIAIRIIGSYFGKGIFGFPAMYYSYGLTIVVSMVFAWIRWFSGKWKRNAVLVDVPANEHEELEAPAPVISED